MEKSLVSTIVMYTIRDDREKTRRRLYELLQEKFSLNDEDMLNESAYHIHNRDINYIDKTLNEIIKQIKQEGLSFGIGDFVEIYYAAHLKNETYSKNLDEIVRHSIFEIKDKVN